MEIGGTGNLTMQQLITTFEMLHTEMRENLRKYSRREPSQAIKYWADINKNISFFSPKAFNRLAKAAIASQASTASAERLFSDLGATEGRQRQSLLSSTISMTETIRVYVQTCLKDNTLPQSGILHPKAASFTSLVDKIA